MEPEEANTGKKRPRPTRAAKAIIVDTEEDDSDVELPKKRGKVGEAGSSKFIGEGSRKDDRGFREVMEAVEEKLEAIVDWRRSVDEKLERMRQGTKKLEDEVLEDLEVMKRLWRKFEKGKGKE